MIYIANDVGSREFFPALSKRADCALEELAFGDFVFAGAGPGSSSLLIAVERKTWPDLLGSLESKRLQKHQLPGLASNYDRTYLLLEGIVRRNMAGGIDQCRGKGNWHPLSGSGSGWSWNNVQGVLHSLEELAGVRVIRTPNQDETVEAIATLYRWWSKHYEAHDTFRVMPKSAKINDSPSMVVDFSGLHEKPSFLRRAIATFRMIGWEKSAGVDARFKTLQEACLAPEKAWQEIPGIGKTLAKRIVRVIKEGGNELDG